MASTSPKTFENALYKQLMVQAFSRYPTGKPLYIEEFISTNIGQYAVEQSGGGTGTLTYQNAADANQLFYGGLAGFKLTSANVAGGFIEMVKLMSYQPNLRFGLEVLFGLTATDAGKCSSIALGLTIVDHNYTAYNAHLYFNPNARILSIDAAGSPVVKSLVGAECDMIDPYVVWQSAKLIIDAGEKKFVKAFWNEFEIDLTSYAMVAAESGHGGARFNPHIIITDLNPSQQYNVYINSFIVTNEE